MLMRPAHFFLQALLQVRQPLACSAPHAAGNPVLCMLNIPQKSHASSASCAAMQQPQALHMTDATVMTAILLLCKAALKSIHQRVVCMQSTLREACDVQMMSYVSMQGTLREACDMQMMSYVRRRTAGSMPSQLAQRGLLGCLAAWTPPQTGAAP